MGASPTPIPWPELFTSLQTGVVEGSQNGVTDVMAMKFPDAGLKYMVDGHSYMGAMWIMNNQTFLSMPEDMRKVVVDGFAALQQATFASPKRKSIQAYEEFAEAGVMSMCQLHLEEKAAFAEAAMSGIGRLNLTLLGRWARWLKQWFNMIRLGAKNICRYPVRSGLTVAGVATGIFLFTTVETMHASLRAVTTASAEETSLVVYRENRFCPFTSRLPEHFSSQIQTIPGVAQVTPVQVVNNCNASLDVVTFRGLPDDQFDDFAHSRFEVLAGSGGSASAR